MSLTELAIKRPPLIIVIFTALLILGGFSYTQLKYELLPNVMAPMVVVGTVYPGAAPQEVETAVTKLIEDSVASVDKVKQIQSSSYENYSSVFLEFQYSADGQKATQDVQKKVNEALSSLPEGARTPTVMSITMDELPIMQVGVTAEAEGRELYRIAKDVIKPRLTRLSGVGQVSLVGGEEREIRVNLDLAGLAARRIPVSSVIGALKSANMDLPAGKVEDKDGDYLIKLSGRYSTIDELRKVGVANPATGVETALEDLADVEDGSKGTSSVSRINGRDSIGIIIMKQSGANAVEVSRLLREELASIQKEYSAQKLVADIAVDSTNFTRESARSVMEDLLLAICLVALVMLAFLHSIRGSIIIMVAIPLSIITTFIGVWAFGMTLNMMTLLALSLVIGILVDDSIVVLENIYRHMGLGKERALAALDGRNEIGFSALSITMVDIVVFLPLALISGMIGNIVRQYALVVVCSTVISLFVSFTVTPMLASRFARLEETKGGPLHAFSKAFEAAFARVVSLYGRLLGWSLRHRARTILVSTGLFIGSFALLGLGLVGSEFVPPVDQGEISVKLNAPTRTGILEMNVLTTGVEKSIYAIPEVSKVFTTVGSSSNSFASSSSPNIAEIRVSLVPPKERKRSAAQVSDEIKGIAKALPGMEVNTSPVGLFGGGESYSLGMNVKGVDRDKIQRAAASIVDAMRRVKGTGEVKISTGDPRPTMDIRIDRKRLADLGLTMDAVGAQLQVAFSGYEGLKLRNGDFEYDMRVVADKSQRSSTADIGRMRFITPGGSQAELAQFADISSFMGPTVLSRLNRLPSVMVLSQAIGRPSGDIAADIRAEMKKIKFDEGIFISEEGDAEAQSTAFASLGLAILVAIVFVYLVMVALFNSFAYPFIVLFSIPVAAVGAICALAITGQTLNIFSILGMIMLIGLVGKNAILLVDRANRNREERGMPLVEALVEAGRTRLRPIVMTTTAMICGMLPIALAMGGSGAELKSSLGIVLIGGLASSMFLTLLLVPAVYSLFEGARSRLMGALRARRAARGSV
jgi:HAE1 family hydrophobic/amphiphilic exporter-1